LRSRSKILGIAAALAFGHAVTVAHAEVTTYTSQAAFDAATGSLTTINFDDVSIGPYAGVLIGFSLTEGGVTFLQPNGSLYVFLPSNYGTFGVTSPYLDNNDGVGGLDITFSAPIYAFSLDFGSVDDFGLSGGTTPTETFDFAGRSETITLPDYLSDSFRPLTFIGFSSDTAFASVSIVDPSEAVAIGDLTFVTSSVPEPSTFAVLAFGVFAWLVSAASCSSGNISLVRDRLRV
jgi:hypothetical protein